MKSSAFEHFSRTRTAESGVVATMAHGSYTALYASPQQRRGEGPDPRDDIHALGVIWHQLLTGDLTSGVPGGLHWMEDLKERAYRHVSLEFAPARPPMLIQLASLNVEAADAVRQKQKIAQNSRIILNLVCILIAGNLVHLVQ